MKKIIYIGLLFLASSCSYKSLIGNNAPYAEDINPISVEKTEKITKPVKEKAITAEEPIYIKEIKDLDKIPENINYKTIEQGTSNSRPVVKTVPAGEFPKIKDIPYVPEAFPSDKKIEKEKKELLSKTLTGDRKVSPSLPNSFTGLDDELLVFTTMEILEKDLPREYKTKRGLLTASLGDEISMNDLEAIELIIKDRMRNLKPVLLSFYGNDTDTLKFDTIGTFLLMGLDPSLIYIDNQDEESSAHKAEVYLYY